MRIEPPDLRRQAAMQLTSLVGQLLRDHLHGAHDVLDVRNFMRDLEAGFTKGGYQIMTDELRRIVDLPDRDPRGWTYAELHAYELARLASLCPPFMMTEGLDKGLAQAWSLGEGFILHEAPNNAPSEPADDPEREP
jgi:hypothetical protein